MYTYIFSRNAGDSTTKYTCVYLEDHKSNSTAIWNVNCNIKYKSNIYLNNYKIQYCTTKNTEEKTQTLPKFLYY